MNAQELFAKALVNYDHSYSNNDTFYYKLPYKKDFDLCNWKPMRMFSGNIIKFYQYHLDKPVVLFTDTEDIQPTTIATDESTISEGNDSTEEFEDSLQDETPNSEFIEADNSNGQDIMATPDSLEEISEVFK